MACFALSSTSVARADESRATPEEAGAPRVAPDDVSATPVLPQDAGSPPTVPETTGTTPAAQETANSRPVARGSGADPDNAVLLDEVVVRSTLSTGDRLRKSAEAVDVIDPRALRTRALDAGDVLARTEGVGVRTTGGLGSQTSLSLNGLYDLQIPILLDGVPIDIAGFPQGIANLPVNLFERLEIYRGVVPIRFGAEALGGAINLVTAPDYYGTGASLSLESGSFGLYRGSVIGRFLHERSGFTAQVAGYADTATNDYRILVDVPDAVGHPVPTWVPLLHNAYGARGVSVESGFVDQPWAKRLLFKLSFNSYEKQVQNNNYQTVPYGEVEQSEKIFGAVLRYQQPGLFGKGTELEAIAAVSRRSIGFNDQSPYVYDWYGKPVATRARPGETDSVPHDSTINETTLLGRLIASWAPAADHEVRLALNLRKTHRSGDDPVNDGPGQLDLAAARCDLTTVVGGLEYTSHLWDRRVENIVAAKAFGYASSDNMPVQGGKHELSSYGGVTFGAGDALRVAVVEPFAVKISFEHATRFPHPNEIFGDGALIQPNIVLAPEQSDNGNAGLELKLGAPRVLVVTTGANGFLRFTRKQIQLFGNGGGFQYQNLLSARTAGVDGYAHASIHDGLFLVDWNVTYQDLRNTSNSGTFAQYIGERLPTRPWFFANGSATTQLRGLFGGDDDLSFGGDVHFVKSFNVGWDTLGDPAFKLRVPDQVVFGAFASFALGRRPRLTGTLDVRNIGNVRTFDSFGVQKPGRSLHLKVSVEF